jgi:hypothetical protein
MQITVVSILVQVTLHLTHRGVLHNIQEILDYKNITTILNFRLFLQVSDNVHSAYYFNAMPRPGIYHSGDAF